MEYYANMAKTTLEKAKAELNSLYNNLNDSIQINEETFKSSEVKEIISELNLQINRLRNYIIPAIREQQEM